MSSQPSSPDPDPQEGPEGTGPPDPEQQRREVEADLTKAKETLERLRRSMAYRRALWGYRLYYIGVLSSAGACGVGLFREEEQDPTLVVLSFGLPLAILGYAFADLQLRRDLRGYLAESSSKVWYARRERKNLFQTAIFRDAFMGRVRD